MPDFKLKDGTIVEVPPDMTPDEKAWLDSQGATPVQQPSVLKDVLKSAAGGLVEGAIRTPLIGADVGHMAKIGLNKVFPGQIGPAEKTSYSDDLINAIKEAPEMAKLAAKQNPNEQTPVNSMPMAPGLNLARLTAKALQAKLAKTPEGTELGFPLPETRAGRYANSIGNGIGGLVLPGSGALRGPTALPTASGIGPTISALTSRVMGNPVAQAGAIGAAGEYAGDVSRGFDETQEQSGLARFLGSSGAALIAALRGHLSASPAARPLHEVMKPSGPAQFNQARAETARLARAGATQNTVGDSFHGVNPQVGAMEREVSNEMGGGALNAKLTGRQTGDLPRLEQASRDQIQNTVVPNRMPSSPTNPSADTQVLAQARSNRSNARQSILESADLVPRQDVASVVRALRQRQLDPRNRGTVDGRAAASGARAVASTPMYQSGPAPRGPIPPRASGPTPVTPLGPQNTPMPAGVPMPPPSIAAPGAAGTAPLGAPMLPAPGNTLPAPAGQAGGAVGPRVLDPNDFGMGPRPMSDFQMPTTPDITDIVTPQAQAPRGANLVALSKIVKSLDTAAPKTQGPAAGVLDAGATAAASREADRALRTVSPEYDWAMTNHASMSPGVEALQTLVDHPSVLRGSASTAPNPVREALAAHLAGVDLRNGQLGGAMNLAGDVAERTHAGDVLASNTSQHGIQGLQRELGQSGGAQVIAPWQASLRALTTRSQRQANEQISRLLANPTPENYKILEELARRDPDLARSMQRQGLLGAVNATTQTEGSAP